MPFEIPKGNTKAQVMSKARPNEASVQEGVISQFPQRSIPRGLAYLAIFSILSLTILFYATSSADTISAISRIDFIFLFLAAFLQFLDLLLGAWRNHILVRKIKPHLGFWLCFKAQLANEFGAAITPGQSGGGAAWLYILHRGGVPVSSSLTVSVIVFISTLAFFLIASFLSLSLVGDQLTSSSLSILIKSSFIVCIGLLMVIAAVFIIPNPIENRLSAAADRLRQSKIRWGQTLADLMTKLGASVSQFHCRSTELLRLQKTSVAKTFVVTGMYYIVKLNLAYLIILGLGIKADYLTAMGILALLRFILYFSPTPGGTGIGEISIAGLMSFLLPIYQLPLYAILYRFFHLFLPAGFGAWVLIHELRQATN